jgi:hypothetical protein
MAVTAKLFQKGEAVRVLARTNGASSLTGGETSLSHKRDSFAFALFDNCSGHVFTSSPAQAAPMAHPFAGWPIQ